MTKAERTERIRMLSRVALGMLKRAGDRPCTIETKTGPVKITELRHNAVKLSRRRWIDEDLSRLEVRFAGKIVLLVEWTRDEVLRTSYKPGDWERELRRLDRLPAFASRATPNYT